MPTSRDSSGVSIRDLSGWVLTLAIAGICVIPHLERLKDPSLFADDVARVAMLRALPMESLLFRPFNEHVAPVFELVSWVTWQLNGHRLKTSAWAFTIASYVPFFACLALLWECVRREFGSKATAWAALAVFSLSGVHAETIYWFSASSFTWAMAWTLAAWLGVTLALEARQPLPWLLLASLSSAMAPACSAIGLLAGPFSAVRALAAPRSDVCSERRRWLGILAPLAGVFLYLSICGPLRYREVVSESLERNFRVSATLRDIGRAPGDVLLPGLFGKRNTGSFPADSFKFGALGLAVALVLIGAWRHPRRRPWILGGLGLIFGGYLLAFGARSAMEGYSALFVQRYHLFPHLGLTFLIAMGWHAGLRRIERRTLAPLLATVLLASTLLAVQRPTIRERARFYRFPDQPKVLSALDRLEEICREHGITQGQALRVFEPVRTRWNPFEFSWAGLLPPTSEPPKVPDDAVPPLILDALSPSEREALWGGMDVSRHLVAEPPASDRHTTAFGQLVLEFRVQGFEGDRYESPGWPAFLEFEMVRGEGSSSTSNALDAETPKVLSLTSGPEPLHLELWWASADASWSETRSFRGVIPESPAPQAWSIPLSCLPHFDPTRADRIRIFLRSKGPLAIGAPRLLR